jgi:hypothetical protein
MKWLLLIESLSLSLLYIVLVAPYYPRLMDPYFSPWELHFVPSLLASLLPTDRFIGTRQEVLAFILLAFLTGFELSRSGPFDFSLMLPQHLYSSIKFLVFATSVGAFYKFRYEKAWSSFVDEGGKETDFLFRYGVLFALTTFLFGIFLERFLFPVRYSLVT